MSATTQVVHVVSEIYNFCYMHLKDSDTPLPSANQVVSYVKMFINFVLQHSPSIVQQWYGPFTKFLIDSNFINMFIALFIVYICWLFVKATFLGAYRLIYGFVRTSFIIVGLLLLLSAVNYIMTISGYSVDATSNSGTTRTFQYQH
ncbi:hypothetical protein A0J61_03107 [Choanephora cucurbitarum]|uniref:Uncharacterized protein n=1 Tax=Choanephora cucurbitarum TaxID=101091 RepID=A0A1C7NNJ9_9FUNG|nr:hypothetical protein A0J61_03107 [Choanephora cucurbitarum]